SGQTDYYAVPRTSSRGGGSQGRSPAPAASADEAFERIEALRQEMFAAAENLEFEKAARLRDELRKLTGGASAVSSDSAPPARRKSEAPPPMQSGRSGRRASTRPPRR